MRDRTYFNRKHFRKQEPDYLNFVGKSNINYRLMNDSRVEEMKYDGLLFSSLNRLNKISSRLVSFLFNANRRISF